MRHRKGYERRVSRISAANHPIQKCQYMEDGRMPARCPKVSFVLHSVSRERGLRCIQWSKNATGVPTKFPAEPYNHLSSFLGICLYEPMPFLSYMILQMTYIACHFHVVVNMLHRRKPFVFHQTTIFFHPI